MAVRFKVGATVAEAPLGRFDTAHAAAQRKRAGRAGKETELGPSFSHGSSAQRQIASNSLTVTFCLFDLDHTKTTE